MKQPYQLARAFSCAFQKYGVVLEGAQSSVSYLNSETSEGPWKGIRPKSRRGYDGKGSVQEPPFQKEHPGRTFLGTPTKGFLVNLQAKRR